MRGLRQQIKDPRDHRLAVEWIRTCIIIHCLIHHIEAAETHHDSDYEEELIGLGMSSDSDGDEEGVGVNASRGNSQRETVGQRKRREVRQSLLDSGLVERRVL